MAPGTNESERTEPQMEDIIKSLMITRKYNFYSKFQVFFLFYFDKMPWLGSNYVAVHLTYNQAKTQSLIWCFPDWKRK